jgi:hypothetical protein
MIVPNVRTKFDRSDAAFIIWLLARGDEAEQQRARERLEEQGLDAILDDPRTFNALMATREFSSAHPGLVFYLLVRHALLESDVSDRVLADYLAALLVAFGHTRRAFRPHEQTQEFFHLVDIVAAGDDASGERAFMLRAHLGEFALWLSGLFPDHITARVQRRGAPGLDYYEQLGATGYRMAADHSIARTHGLDRVYRECAETFPVLRTALNRIADRHLFPASGDRIERLLRQVADGFRDGGSNVA